MGFNNKALEFYTAFDAYCENDQSIYKPASLATKYIREGKFDMAIDQYQLFATQNNYQYFLSIVMGVSIVIFTITNFF